ncbi:MAG: glycosyltransferase family 4 protein [Niabella sp.]
MKIGVEVQRLFRKKKHGMEVVALELLRQLQVIDRYNQYKVFVKNDEDDACISNTENMDFIKVPGRTYFDWEQFSLPKAVKKHNIDFLHSTCNTSALNCKVPLLLTLHDIIYLEELNFKGSAYQNFGNIYRKFIVPRIVAKSKYIITVSNFEKETIKEKLHVPDEKIKVVYNAVSPKFKTGIIKSEIDNFRKHYQLPEKFILFLGNTAPKKNTKNVISAYTLYCKNVTAPIPLVILDYDKSLVEATLKNTKQEEFLKNFVFPGFIPSDKMPLMYNAAYVFLYPSLRESFGLPILESMACGTPVITSSTSSMPEIGGNAAIYANPYSVEDILCKLIGILHDNETHSQVTAKGIERAATFNWENAAKELLAIYQSM